ncbi:MAG: T9SS type A sorting domain-containing protein [Bacteroidota bacterium]
MNSFTSKTILFLLLLPFTKLLAQYEVAFEIESVAVAGKWIEATDYAGFSGTGYYYWSGGTSFGRPPSGSDLTYTINIPTSGSYRIYIRGMRRRGVYGCPENAENDRCNDVWLTIDNGNPVKKMVKGSWNNWIWNGNWEPGDRVINSNHTFTQGQHTLTITGRSFGTMIDGIVLTKDDSNPPSGPLASTTSILDEPYHKTLVYPNPVKSLLHLTDFTEVKELRIYSMHGQHIQTVEHASEAIQVGHLAKGLYVVKVSSINGSTSTLKFTKE